MWPSASCGRPATRPPRPASERAARCIATSGRCTPRCGRGRHTRWGRGWGAQSIGTARSSWANSSTPWSRRHQCSVAPRETCSTATRPAARLMKGCHPCDRLATGAGLAACATPRPPPIQPCNSKNTSHPKHTTPPTHQPTPHHQPNPPPSAKPHLPPPTTTTSRAGEVRRPLAPLRKHLAPFERRSRHRLAPTHQFQLRLFVEFRNGPPN